MDKHHQKVPNHEKVESNEHSENATTLRYQRSQGEGELLFFYDDIPCCVEDFQHRDVNFSDYWVAYELFNSLLEQIE